MNEVVNLFENEVELSVSQVSQMISGVLSSNFNDVVVKGEISGLKAATSGHIYFSIKDENAVLNAICWKGVATTLVTKLEEGMEVVIRGGIQTYPNRSNYQIIAREIRTSGIGALMALLEKRKKQLAAEGLFDAARKRPLPFMPECIGVVTSPTGAVIRDILHRLEERWGCNVLVYPCLVQGNGAAEQIAAGIEFFNSLDGNNAKRPDVLIVARGGGSIEDLWAFNEEIVVRAAANSEIPLISAVGHETDTTLIDYASDRRAPTPTAAAEIATPVKDELIALTMDYRKRLFSSISRTFTERNNYVTALARGLISPARLLDNMAQRLDEKVERLKNSVANIFANKRQELERLQLKPFILTQLINNAGQKLNNLQSLMNSYDYRNVLKRGFTLVKDSNNKLVKNLSDLAPEQNIQIEFADGVGHAVFKDDTTPENKPAKIKVVKEKIVKPVKTVENKDSNQESLF